jgi:hypothetical protein
MDLLPKYNFWYTWVLNCSVSSIIFSLGVVVLNFPLSLKAVKSVSIFYYYRKIH